METHSVAKRAARDTPAAGWVGARFGVVGEGLEACGLVAWIAQSSLRDGLAHSEDSKASSPWSAAGAYLSRVLKHPTFTQLSFGNLNTQYRQPAAT